MKWMKKEIERSLEPVVLVEVNTQMKILLSMVVVKMKGKAAVVAVVIKMTALFELDLFVSLKLLLCQVVCVKSS